MKILIITKSNDHEGINLTIDAIKNAGGIPFRFDTDLYPENTKFDIYFGKYEKKTILTTKDYSCNLMDIDSIYYRRVAYGKNLPHDMDTQYRTACINEIKSVFEGFLTKQDSFHLDKYWSVRKASMKQFQLRLVENLGFNIPRTLISNNPESVMEFSKSCPDGIVAKMHTSFAIYENNQEKVVFTSKVTEENLKNLDGLKYSPMIFQELIEKKLELRVTIVGNKVFCSSIDSQKIDSAKIDWRVNGLDFVNDWQPFTLPDDLVEKLLNLMNKLDLNYGAADFIITPDNKYVFLEVNPVGEYFWLDKQHNYQISKSIADCLSSKNRRIT